eukprot:5358722-Pyramimonas_sp.AAC.1
MQFDRWADLHARLLERLGPPLGSCPDLLRRQGAPLPAGPRTSCGLAVALVPLPRWVAPVAEDPPPRVLSADVLLPCLPLAPSLSCSPAPRAPLRHVAWYLRVLLRRVVQVDVPASG